MSVYNDPSSVHSPIIGRDSLADEGIRQEMVGTQGRLGRVAGTIASAFKKVFGSRSSSARFAEIRPSRPPSPTSEASRQGKSFESVASHGRQSVIQERQAMRAAINTTLSEDDWMLEGSTRGQRVFDPLLKQAGIDSERLPSLKNEIIGKDLLKEVTSHNTAAYGSNVLLRKYDDECARNVNILNGDLEKVLVLELDNKTIREPLARLVGMAKELQGIWQDLGSLGLKGLYNDNIDTAGTGRPANTSTEMADWRIVDDYKPGELNDNQRKALENAKAALTALRDESKKMDGVLSRGRQQFKVPILPSTPTFPKC